MNSLGVGGQSSNNGNNNGLQFSGLVSHACFVEISIIILSIYFINSVY